MRVQKSMKTPYVKSKYRKIKYLGSIGDSVIKRDEIIEVKKLFQQKSSNKTYFNNICLNKSCSNKNYFTKKLPTKTVDNR